MAKITRYTGNLLPFGINATGTHRTVFGGVAQSDTLDGNIISDFLVGWENGVDINGFPPEQFFNATTFVATQLSAYLHQSGIAEWDSLQEYYIGNLTNVAGVIYKSKTDANIGNDPTSSPANWEIPDAATLGGNAAAYYQQALIDVSSIELGDSGSGNRDAKIDFHSDDTYTDYALRIIRESTGPNATTSILHRGTGDFNIGATEASATSFKYQGNTVWTSNNDGDGSGLNADMVNGLHVKIVNIGDWDMNVSGAGSASVGIAHGLTIANIRSISVSIIKDAVNPDVTDLLTLGGGYWDLDNVSGDVNLRVETGGFYDSASYDDTSYNRGWITIQYVD